MQQGTFENIPLPQGIRSRFVPNINGLTIHLLEASFESQERPYAVLLHGGGLQWYRCATGGIGSTEPQIFSGRTIDVPSMFIAGKNDWGRYQRPGNLERMQTSACTHMQGCHVVDGAGR